MNLYFCGLDQFNCLISEGQFEGLQSIKTPVKLNGFSKVVMQLHLSVFKKIGIDSEWFISGMGIPEALKLFSEDLNISEVCFSSKGITGLSKNDNIYRYDIDFEMDSISDILACGIKIVTLPDPSLRIVQIVSNHEHVYGLDDRSCVHQIGDNIVLKWRFEGVVVVKIACGFGHFVAISDTGALYSWGSGGRGELGHTDHNHVMVNCEIPTRIDFFDDLPSVIKDIACGGWHTLALTSDGDIYSWGWNESGQLGYSVEKLSTVSGEPYPVDLGSAEDPIVNISAGARHSVALLKSGKVFSWGLNKHGQLGLGDSENRHEPVELKNNKAVEIVCGRWWTFLNTV